MGIFRAIILLTGVTVLLPSPPVEQAVQPPLAVQETTSVVSAASQTVTDMAAFCSRQPGVCETAGYVAAKLEAKAKYSVRLIYEWASEANGVTPDLPFGNQAVSDPMATGSTKFADGRPTRSTLQLEDLLPAWRGAPVPDKG